MEVRQQVPKNTKKCNHSLLMEGEETQLIVKQ